jgi:hypothetical protein
LCFASRSAGGSSQADGCVAGCNCFAGDSLGAGGRTDLAIDPIVPHTTDMSGPAQSMPLRPGAAYRVHPADEADLRAAAEEIESGRIVDLASEELAEWEATGELPASVEARFGGVKNRGSSG